MTEIDSLPLCDVSFQEEKWAPFRKDIMRLLPQTINAVRNCFPSFSSVGHIDVILADNALLKDLNYRYRGKNRPTNVLSFPQEDFKKGEEAPEGAFVLLGDIAMAYDVIAVEAKKEEKTFLDHFCHLLVHGCLHLLGFDHETDEDQEEMESLEVKILSTINIANPYET